jgi:hypothetical protein
MSLMTVRPSLFAFGVGSGAGRFSRLGIATVISRCCVLPAARERLALRLFLQHDDKVREFDYVAGAEKSSALAKSEGWTVVSMKNDWKEVFP